MGRREDEEKAYEQGWTRAETQGPIQSILETLLFGVIDSLTEDKKDPYVRGRDDYESGKPYRPHG
jgi:hypothetical protein